MIARSPAAVPWAWELHQHVQAEELSVKIGAKIFDCRKNSPFTKGSGFQFSLENQSALY